MGDHDGSLFTIRVYVRRPVPHNCRGPVSGNHFSVGIARGAGLSVVPVGTQVTGEPGIYPTRPPGLRSETWQRCQGG